MKLAGHIVLVFFPPISIAKGFISHYYSLLILGLSRFLCVGKNLFGFLVGFLNLFGIIVPLTALTCDFDLKLKSTLSIRFQKVPVQGKLIFSIFIY